MQADQKTLIAALLLTLAVSQPAAAPSEKTDGEVLVDALDAAWVRILDNGVFHDIVRRHDAEEVVINISDCLPKPEMTPFPENPRGKLQAILDRRQINVGVSSGGTLDAGTTATLFIGMSDEILAAIMREVAAHYDTGPISIAYKTIKPPYPITSTLDSGEIDVVGLVNALGGETEDLRRRSSRRFTCTITATRQVLWVKKDGGPDWADVYDALTDPDAQLCAGPLSNQLSHAYFDLPGQSVGTEFYSDLDLCLTKLLNGEVDAMVSPFPHERFFPSSVDTDGDGERDTPTAGRFRSIDTNIVAGTPLWIALD